MRTPYDFHLDKKTRFLPDIAYEPQPEEMIGSINAMMCSLAVNGGKSLNEARDSAVIAMCGKSYTYNQAIDMLRARAVSVGYQLDAGTGEKKVEAIGLLNDDATWEYHGCVSDRLIETINQLR
ncbi:TPA: hypothetical protein ACSTL5_003609 [Serratia fonticola]